MGVAGGGCGGHGPPPHSRQQGGPGGGQAPWGVRPTPLTWEMNRNVASLKDRGTVPSYGGVQQHFLNCFPPNFWEPIVAPLLLVMTYFNIF